MSSSPCGCDPEAIPRPWVCNQHMTIEVEARIQQLADEQRRAYAEYAKEDCGAVPINQETRVVDPQTGGAKGRKLARFSLIPSEFLWALAEHYGRGSEKYADRNWEKGYAWSLCVDALQRHLHQWLTGE